MGLGDLGNAIIIITIFILIQVSLTLTANVSHIKRNWDKYKCNPAIIPFASTFGHSTRTTFNECIQEAQVDFMGVFLEPIYSSLFYFANNGAIFTEMFERLKLFGDAENSAMGNFADLANARLFGLVNAVSNVYIGISDTFSKLVSSINIIFNTIESGMFMIKQGSCELGGTVASMVTGIERDPSCGLKALERLMGEGFNELTEHITDNPIDGLNPN